MQLLVCSAEVPVTKFVVNVPHQPAIVISAERKDIGYAMLNSSNNSNVNRTTNNHIINAIMESPLEVGVVGVVGLVLFHQV